MKERERELDFRELTMAKFRRITQTTVDMLTRVLNSNHCLSFQSSAMASGCSSASLPHPLSFIISFLSPWCGSLHSQAKNHNYDPAIQTL